MEGALGEVHSPSGDSRLTSWSENFLMGASTRGTQQSHPQMCLSNVLNRDVSGERVLMCAHVRCVFVCACSVGDGSGLCRSGHYAWLLMASSRLPSMLRGGTLAVSECVSVALWRWAYCV